MLPYILHYMKISKKEIKIVESKSNNERTLKNSLYGVKKHDKFNKSLANKNFENIDFDEDLDYLEYFVYNPYWTLRKCSSKLVDKISCIYSKQTLYILKAFLESDLQCNDWIKKYFYFFNLL